MAILSILICSLPERESKLNELLDELYSQSSTEIEIAYDVTPKGEKTIGQKRNELLQQAKGKYVCFIDDDDMVSADYINEIVRASQSNADCVSLRGVITWDGKNPELFEHSIRYEAYATTGNTIKYERFPNHLNPIKTEIAKKFKFPESNFGEDTDWATQIHNSGLIKTETYIDKVLYHYKFIPNK